MPSEKFSTFFRVLIFIITVSLAVPSGHTASATVLAGQSVTLTTTSDGTAPFTYLWFKDGMPLSGVTGAVYMINNVQPAHAGVYHSVVSNPIGATTAASAVIAVASLTSPVITTQPVSQTVTTGASVTFAVAASGTPAPTYQWQKNGVNISGATGGSYVLSGTTTGDAGTYRVVATNSAGSVTSAGAVLTVDVPYTIAAPSNLSATAGNGVITLAWSDNSTNEAGFEVQYSLDGVQFLVAETLSANTVQYTDLGLPDTTTFTYRVRAFLGSSYSSFSNVSSATTPASTVNWTRTDVGNVGLPGSGSEGSTMITISGSGGDIWGVADAFRFVYQPWRGDGTIITQVASLDNTDPFAKAGLMFRDRLEDNARNAFVFVTPSKTITLQTRTSKNGKTTANATKSGNVPVWLKLVRAGNQFTASYSANGITWTQLGSKNVPMGNSLYVGLAVTSRNNSASTIAVFQQTHLGSGSTPDVVAAPSNLSATASASAITLNWDDNSANEAGFEVQYSVDGLSFFSAGTVGTNVTSFTDEGLPNATVFTYRVRAFLGTTLTPYSNTVSATTSPSNGN